MAKYIIHIERVTFGDIWLDALNFDFYYFLNEDKVPDGKTISYIKEIYNSKIENATFGEYSLYSILGNKVIVSGYALKMSGKYRRYYNNIYPTFPTRKFFDICKEPIFTKREYETVILVWRNYGKDRMAIAGHNYQHSGFFVLNIHYEIYRRALSKIQQDYKYQSWDYFKIPRDADVNYIPNEHDKKNPYINMHTMIIPYTAEKHYLLKQICDAGADLGEKLEEVINGKKLEVGIDFSTKLLSASH